MVNFMTQLGWGSAILAGCFLFGAVLAGVFAYKRAKKLAQVVSQAADPSARELRASEAARTAAMLPAYQPCVETRQRVTATAKRPVRPQRRPGLASRWKSQDRLVANA